LICYVDPGSLKPKIRQAQLTVSQAEFENKNEKRLSNPVSLKNGKCQRENTCCYQADFII